MKPLKFIKKLYLFSYFKEKVLPKLTDEVTDLELKEYVLPKLMNDTEIQKKYNSTPIDVKYFASILQKTLKNENKFCIFHVKLKDNRVVAVNAYWRADDRGWSLSASELDYVYRWYDGVCFFSPVTADSKTLKPSESLKPLILKKLEELKELVEKIN